MNSTCIIGFDSAWANKAPGAICALIQRADGNIDFIPPQPVQFDEALSFIKTRSEQCDACLVALDQPTIVPNARGFRPVEKVAGQVLGDLPLKISSTAS